VSIRRLVVAGLLVAALAAVAVVVLRQSLLRGPLRAAAEQRLSATLGQPVTIGSLGVSIVPRVALTGSNIRVGSGEQEAPGIRLESIRIVPRLRSLLGNAIEIDEARLDGFVVSVLRGRDGRWHAPAAAPAPTPAGSAVSIARVRVTNGRLRVFDEVASGDVRETSGIGAIETDIVVDEQGLRFSPLGGRVGGAAIEGAARANKEAVRLEFTAASLADADLPAMLALVGSSRPEFLRLDAPASVSAAVRIDRAASRLSGTGTLAAPAVTLDPLRVRDFEAAFTIAGSRLTFEPTTFTLYEGAHRGTVSIALDRTPPRWSTNSHIERIDLGAFLDTLAGSDTRLDGTAQLDAALAGPLDAVLARTLQGRARVVVSDGVVHQFPLLGAINSALRLTGGDMRDTKFERLSGTVSIANGRATSDDLLLEAGHITVAAAGTIGVDRTLDLRGRAVMSAERTAAAVASVRELARLRRSGRIELPLTISGTLDNPRFGIDVKGAIGQGITDELFRRLRGIIRN
jgi:AsmA protein